MRNTCRLVLLIGLAGCATTGSSHEVHYDRAEVCYVTAPVRAEAHEAESEHAAETETLSASSVQPIPAAARRPRPEQR